MTTTTTTFTVMLWFLVENINLKNRTNVFNTLFDRKETDHKLSWMEVSLCCVRPGPGWRVHTLAPSPTLGLLLHVELKRLLPGDLFKFVLQMFSKFTLRRSSTYIYNIVFIHRRFYSSNIFQTRSLVEIIGTKLGGAQSPVVYSTVVYWRA